MVGNWRRRALAQVAIAVLCACCVAGTPALAASKAAKKAPEKQNADESQSAEQPAKKKKQDPAEAQRAVDAALKQLEAGKADLAVQGLSAVLAGGNLPHSIMSKALLYRGIAYRQQKKPAQAIADLTSALWLKGGLSETDRADALHQRAAAYQEAGLSEGGDAQAPALPRGAKTKEHTASAGSSWSEGTTSTETSGSASQAGTPAKSGAGWDFFGSLFGGSSAAASATDQAPPAGTSHSAAASAPAAHTTTPTTSTSGWSRNTQVYSAPAPVETSSLPTKHAGRFRVQLGAVRTQQEAQAIAAKLKREHGPLLASREPEIDEAVLGNMGSFYRVRVGPFATQQETQAVCSKLKASGLDCLIITQ